MRPVPRPQRPRASKIRGIVSSASAIMGFLDTAFYLVSTALALYFSYVRFRARMPLFGHAMTGTALFHVMFALEGMDLPANIAAAAFVLLYMKSLAILQEHGLSDGSLS